MVVWPLVGVEELPGRMRRSFELVDTMYAAEGWMYRSWDSFGVMSLIPPDAGERLHEIDVLVARAIAAITPDAGARYGRFWAWIDQRLPVEPHWLLDQVAVDPVAQGRGIGTALIRFALARASADGKPLVLATGVARNVAYYEGFGFTVMSDADAPGSGPHVWFMRLDR